MKRLVNRHQGEILVIKEILRTEIRLKSTVATGCNGCTIGGICAVRIRKKSKGRSIAFNGNDRETAFFFLW